MGSPSAPKAPAPPPAPTQTRKRAQQELDQQLKNLPNFEFFGNPIFGNSNVASNLVNFSSSSQAQLDARPDSDFLPALEQRDFQALDSQIRGGSSVDTQNRQSRNKDMRQSLLDLLGEDIDSPTIL